MQNNIKNKFAATAIILSVLTLAACSETEKPSLPVYSKPGESSVQSTVTSDSESINESNVDAAPEQSQNKLEDELNEKIETFGYVKFNSVKASNCDRVVEYYRNENSYFTGEDDPLNFIESQAALVAERDGDGRVVSFGNISRSAGSGKSSFVPMKYWFQYNEKDRRAYFYTFSKGESLPTLEIFEDTDEKRFYEIMGIEYENANEAPTISDDGLPYYAIEDLDVIMVSKYPLVTYPKSEFRENDGMYTADFVRCVDTAAMNIKYNDINSVKNADDFDDELLYWDDKDPTENYDLNNVEAYMKDVKVGDKIGELTVISCYSIYSDGVSYDEDDEKYYNYVTGPTKTDIAFDGEITLTGYAISYGDRVVFSPYANSVMAAFPIIPPNMVGSGFAGYGYPNVEQRNFVYTAIGNAQIDITGKISAEIGKTSVKEVEVTLKRPEIFLDKVGDSGIGSGIYGNVIEVKIKGTIL